MLWKDLTLDQRNTLEHMFGINTGKPQLIEIKEGTSPIINGLLRTNLPVHDASSIATMVEFLRPRGDLEIFKISEHGFQVLAKPIQTAPKITRLITHDGSFHADDLLAYSVLNTVFPGATLTRTRDAKTLSEAGEDTIIFDVGNEFDPERQRFDHHQPDKPLREDEIPYSSFGLIWSAYGLSYIQATIAGISEDDAALVHARLNRTFVRDIDAVDNGTVAPDQVGITHPLSFPTMIADFRPDFDNDDPHAMEEAFHLAASAANLFLSQKVRKVTAGIRSQAIVMDAIENKPHPNWIELPRGMNYQGPIMRSKDKDILYVIAPSPEGWNLNCVNVASHSYECRKELPARWAGLRDEELSKVIGVDDAIFCHTGRFFACAKSRDTIMKMLEEALAE